MNIYIPCIENLAQTVPGVIYRIDLQSNLPVFLSDAIFEASGYTADEIMSGSVKWLDLVVEDDQQMVLKNTDSHSPLPGFSIEYRIRHKSGAVRWILNRAVSVWEEGKPRWRDGIILDISTAKVAALELETKKKEFANLLNSLDDIVFEIDSHGRFKNYYAKEWHTFILPPNAFIDKTITQAFRSLPDVGILFDHAYQKTLAEKKNQKIEYPHVIEGRTVWFRAKFINLQQPGTVSIMVRDITKRKNAELALKKREQELELAVKGGDLGTWNWYIETGEISFNEGCANMLGYSAEEIHPHISALEKLIHPEDKGYVIEGFDAHLNGKTEFFEAEYRLKHKEGLDWVWVLHRSKIVEQNPDGRPLRMSGTFLDISGRKKAEYANIDLQYKLEEFKAAVNEGTIVSIADLTGTIKYANHKFAEISQYTPGELIGKKHNLINSGYHPRSFWQEMWRTITRGNVWRAEVKNKRKDGTYYWVDTFIIPLRNAGNQVLEYLSIRNDITEKKENEIRLQEALEKAKESDRLKSAFLANISHEIRTPMNAILGFSELLLKAKHNLPEQKQSEFIRLIFERSQDLLAVVNNILEISKIEAGQISSISFAGRISELFHRLVTTFKAETLHLKNKNIRISAVNKLRPSQSIVKADFLRLYQVLNNLLSNAARFTKQGSIELGCRLVRQEILEFWVRDTGIGITEDKLDVIFLPFRQADDTIHQEYGGTGLGLAISKGFVELWGGRIWAESELGKGSVFYFTIPYVPAPPNPDALAHAGPEWKDKTILLFYEGALGNRLPQLLSERGIAIVNAPKKSLGIKELNALTIDVAIVDLRDPDKNTMEQAKIMKAIGIPVIALTTFDHTAKRTWDRNDIDHYLPMPASSDDLASLLTRIFGEYAAQNQGRK